MMKNRSGERWVFSTHTPFSLPILQNLCETLRMNRLLILPVLLLTLLVGTPASSADFEKGLTAAQSGDYATALREWTPLAEQGHALAQSHLGWMYENGEGVPNDYFRGVTPRASKIYFVTVE